MKETNTGYGEEKREGVRGGAERACQCFLISAPAFGLSLTYIQYRHDENEWPEFAFSLSPFLSNVLLCVFVVLHVSYITHIHLYIQIHV